MHSRTGVNSWTPRRTSSGMSWITIEGALHRHYVFIQPPNGNIRIPHAPHTTMAIVNDARHHRPSKAVPKHMQKHCDSVPIHASTHPQRTHPAKAVGSRLGWLSRTLRLPNRVVDHGCAGAPPPEIPTPPLIRCDDHDLSLARRRCVIYSL